MEFAIPVCASIEQEGARHHFLQAHRVYSDEFRNPGNIVEREVWSIITTSPRSPSSALAKQCNSYV
jgi:hypothetical protein